MFFWAGGIGCFAQVVVSGPATCRQSTTCTYSASSGKGPYKYSLAAGSIGSIDSSTGAYTAPSSITPVSTYGGCPLFPNNSVFATSVKSLPVSSSSALWTANLNGTMLPHSINVETALWLNQGSQSSDPTQTMQFLYTGPNNGLFHLASVSNNLTQRTEAGALTWNTTVDRHVIQSFKDSCNVEEIYKPYTTGYYAPNSTPARGA